MPAWFVFPSVESDQSQLLVFSGPKAGRKGSNMKSNNAIRFLTFTAVLLFSVSAFAGTGTINVSEDTTLHGKQLKAGEYKVKWSDDGAISLSQNGKEVMSTQGKVVEKTDRSNYNSVVKQVQSDGSTKVTELRFGGKRTAIVLEESVAQKE